MSDFELKSYADSTLIDLLCIIKIANESAYIFFDDVHMIAMRD